MGGENERKFKKNFKQKFYFILYFTDLDTFYLQFER